MKKYAMIFSALCTGLLFTSCNKDPEYFTLEEQPDEMHVKSSVEEITLSKSSADQKASATSYASIPPVRKIVTRPTWS